MVQTVENWGDAVLLSVTQALSNLLGFLPALIGAIVVLVLGWIVSGILAGLVERALKAVGFEKASQSAGIAGFIEKSGSEWTASKVLAEIVKWFIRLVAIQAAAQILGMGQISEIVNSILLFLPNVVVALAIIVLGAFIAKFVAGLVRASVSEMGFGNPDVIATIAQYATSSLRSSQPLIRSGSPRRWSIPSSSGRWPPWRWPSAWPLGSAASRRRRR